MQTTSTGAYPAVVQPPHGAPTHVWDYWAVVLKRLPLVVLFVLVAVGGSYLVTSKQQKLYKASATIQILPPSVLRGEAYTPTIVSDEMYLRTQLVILAQPDTILRAVNEQNLASQPDFQGKSAQQIAQLAVGNVECAPRRGVYLVDVSVHGPDPKVLAPLANALVRTFQQMQKSESKRMREDRKALLEDKRSTAEANIRLLQIDKTAALQGRSYSSPTTFEFEFRRIQTSLDRWTLLKDELHVELLKKEPTVEAFKKAMQDPDKDKALAALAHHEFIQLNTPLQQIDERIIKLEEIRDKLVRDGLGKADQRVIDAQEAVDLTVKDRTRTIQAEVNRYLLEYQGQVTMFQNFQKQVEGLMQEMTDVNAVKLKVDSIDADIEMRTATRETASRELELLSQNGADDKDAVRIEVNAVEPTSPYSPNSTTNLTLGLVLGVVGGIALAFLLDYLDDTIRTKDELAKIAPDVPLLGVVPNIEAKKSETAKKDLFAANQPKSTISEAYRGVRTALTLSARGPQQKTMLLTSAGPREGKTTTALNLATVLAFSGARTLIIDADLRKPRAHASFGLPNKKGLTNLIVGEEDPSEYCQRTSLERVDLLTSGPIPPNPSELLGRPRMREILRKLRERYDQIIIDTPPIGAVTDAAVMATMVDGVILVVHAGKTRRGIVSRGIEQLRYINAPIIGVILNNLRLGRGRYYPGYYHYYYYYTSHYGAEDGKPKKAAAAKVAAPEASPGGDSAES